MMVMGFLFSAVGAYLTGLVGSSNQPVSGLALSTLILSALLMVGFGVTGLAGIAAVLGVAAVVSAAVCVSGSLVQDLKVGHLLGATPWKMEVAEIVATVVVSFVLVFPIVILHEGNIKLGGMGIGHVVARQELREAMGGLNLPARERLHPDGDLFAAAKGGAST